MTSTDPGKTEAAHLVVGLSCNLPGNDGVFRCELQQLINDYFSPFKNFDFNFDAGRGHFEPSSKQDALIKVVHQAFLDAGMQSFPENCAVFLVLDDALLDPHSSSAALNQYFQSQNRDITVMLGGDSRDGIFEALNWLDRRECEFAMVVAAESLDQKVLPQETESRACGFAAVLFGSRNAVKDANLRAYVSVERADWDKTDAAAVSLVEVAGADWFDSSLPIREWELLRSGKNSRETAGLKGSVVRDSLCYFSSLAFQQGSAKNLSQVLAVISLSLAGHLRIIPASSRLPLGLDNPKLQAQTFEPRPWIQAVSPVEPSQPRFSFAAFNGARDGLLISECGTDVEPSFPRALKIQSSELFVFGADTDSRLRAEIKKFLQELTGSDSTLWQLAFRNNCCNFSGGSSRLAIVASSKNELETYLRVALEHLETRSGMPLPKPLNQATGIYYTAKPALKSGKLVFVLPGLGASYPQMLLDLCCLFPEVRQVFDCVEMLALKAGDQIVPSRAIFPVSGSRFHVSSQTMLATMDSAVVTLLLAEWALFALLNKLGISPDALLGCSTGEFAVITMSESMDILEGAETFYRLSTEVSRSIPVSDLIELRSIRVSASYEGTVKPLLGQLAEPVYLAADLSDSCVLLSGRKAPIEELCKLLRQDGVEYLNLPVAIPYHTPLVAGKVSDKDEEVRRLEMRQPRIESWSCSTGGIYPQNFDELRKISTDLFEKPIRLRETLNKLYESGARTFIELGPKGGLVPFISEVLAGKEHLSVAANLQARTGVDQLNAMLAMLACGGIEMRLQALYERRMSVSPGAFDKACPGESRSEIYEAASLKQADAFESGDLRSLQLSDSVYDFLVQPQDLDVLSLMTSGSVEALPEWLEQAPEFSDEVMLNYLSSMRDLQSALLNSQESMMMAYLQSYEEEPEIYQEDALAPSRNLRFFTDAELSCKGGVYTLPVSLDILEYPFLLDHAIGGRINSPDEGEKVFLLPLMVALEIMAEGASLFHPGEFVRRLSDIRAYKRIRAGVRAVDLLVELRAVSEDALEACIRMKEVDPDNSDLLASCVLEFGEYLEAGPLPRQFPVQDLQASRFQSANLYGEGAMFHGRRLQAVESIDLVSKRLIEGKIRRRPAFDWFSPERADNAEMLIDPLLLDNASQFVLFQMLEHEFPVSALLPFHIESIKFFAGYEARKFDMVQAKVFLRSMSLRGTEAEIELCDEFGSVIAVVDSISSRAIVLPEHWREFVLDPGKLLSKPIRMSALTDAVIASVAAGEMPSDETALDWLSDYLLSNREQKEWRSVRKTEKRRLDWITGRIAAKDAVRMLVRESFDLDLRPAQIEILKGPSGAPNVEIAVEGLLWTPAVSISHCASMAVALAEVPRENRFSGIDVEEIREREDGFSELAFSKSEQNWIESFPVSERSKIVCRLWTAKEAAAKSHGIGFADGLKSLELVSAREDSGAMQMAFRAQGRSELLYSCLVRDLPESGLALAVVRDCLSGTQL